LAKPDYDDINIVAITSETLRKLEMERAEEAEFQRLIDFIVANPVKAEGFQMYAIRGVPVPTDKVNRALTERLERMLNG
jgi:hypothetical protein